jgi:hypothetical protein
MKKIKKYFYLTLDTCRLSLNKDGFAIIAAMLAILILTAVGLLVFTVTTQDIRVSTRVVGEKKAFAATEAGIHNLIQVSNTTAGNIATYTTSANFDDPTTWPQVDPGADPDSRYFVGNSTITGVPMAISMPGYEIGGSAGKQWGQTVSNKSVTGTNTRYGSMVTVDIGIGYGPVEITTGQPAAGG